MIKQKLFGENQRTNKELAQMAGAHKNELVRITNDDYGIIVKIIHRDYTARRIIQKDENQNLFIHVKGLANPSQASQRFWLRPKPSWKMASEASVGG